VLARAADGSMRDGLSLLDQAIAFGGGRLAMDDLEKMLGLVDFEHVASLVRNLAAGNPGDMLNIVEDLVAQSRDLDTVLVNLAELLHRVTLVQCVPGYRDPERSDWPAIESLAENLSAEDAQLYYQIAIKGRNELGLAPDPRTGLEMTLLRMLAFRPAGGGAGSSAPQPASKPRVEAQATSSALPAGARHSGRAAEAAKPVEPAPTPAPRAEDTAAEPPASPTGPIARSSGLLQGESAAASDDEWLSLIEQLGINGQVRELARNIELKAKKSNIWEFVIIPALKHLGSKNCIERLGQAISNHVGQDIKVKLVDESTQSLRTAAAKEQQQIHQNMSEAERAIQDDPTVKDLKDKMGARIVDDTIQPIQ
jgi:DNA polymerase-3 subunit gamma/tau